MRTTPLIIVGLLTNLAVFIAYPETGRMGVTFLYVSAILWTAFAIFLGRTTPAAAFWKVTQGLVFTLACLISGLCFLPQKDGVSALTKFNRGIYPDRRSVFLGLLRLGLDCPALLPPQKEEVLP